MGKRPSFHNEQPEADQRLQVEKQMVKTEFARRLSRQITLKGWTQAEFSKRAQALAPEGMRIGPDSISHYLNARYMPSPSHLNVMARALSVDVLELLPVRGVPEAGESLPPVGLQDLNNGSAWLRVNQAVSWPVAIKVLALLKGEDL